MKATESGFATAPDGGAVTLFVLENRRGVRVSVMSQEATLLGVEVPDRGHFPSSILRPGETYHEKTVHELALQRRDP